MDKVVHFEIEADDLDRAQKFYQEIFGWEIQNVSAPGMEYRLINTVETDEKQMPKEAGAINGGLQKKTGQSKGVVIVIDVKSIDETLKKVQERGSKIVMPKTQVGDMGLYARVTDTEGNVIGIWEDVKKM
ncbi:glyoxalase [Candidatus Roizmanbacteria bacterium RIFCSPHIGHO2_02_FULL_37_15]|uniref:Glyoxalase n=1 Tax=Candidatus Roizmanbacteria bacterium RIFCSPLOWO2_01_FULL_37_16 TaxID=1802058 RepID=A0A1F7IPL2_9BACT|nr:MAG: glyoxalase [Candidatus Roizmanbacteria bacterium RIFCSPHIGHO2_01_FULL_37_16b]OGK22142.1 MAG: glyoxalase [Candidatus Roizmanbacteria bacterium RIFCSPHIGHO2_02_FULL_37_15]OGK34106.1 MAG: glyoxalase [Candidatus Roizmanbacteria bacterium RIFCSPHIGHO2_12_FULL_36_11]OGK45313.1 MAG: glyoxalase [Candidatus Roizmanbacteria bacterium RIFCSPLOWO2_01_FULL_37_16]OGK57123.1 MAG: glyoxalase [Candidatus Roizmanbacteria bacterium RIFCSPLOWO2_02_FULL_37_9]